ncbi:nitrogen regulation protein NR(II) [Bermanella marisrubri]|uniref:Sensory histidine kinase/phosphatase NtrB n=1 Tax=Bermanella marisrubri TaxID=207949 RepID=Q1N2H2_9GAMM|nr:nitrogen regulation protein NR(II) [Bermanella marisrubri]EAT12435.1 Signal transduction histidine kinase, nitrogen specific [Oceanobacter sp. RED65] [Bermanella marisrubri]QIZ85515.1 nitrogen regulation protein NR(II) [Bermanella marisrubri]
MADFVFYKQLINHLDSAILVVDDQLCVTYLNPAAEALLQVSGRRCVGLPVKHFFLDSLESSSTLEQSIAEDTSFTKREAHVRLQNQTIITLDYSVSPVEFDNSLCLVIEMHARDRLLRISKEEELISAQATTQALVRGMAHEIKNPLGGIRGSAQLLERMLDNSELQEFTQIIIDEVDRLRNLVDKMLGPNKLLEREDTNIHEVLERVHSLISVESEGKVKLRRDYDPSIPEFLADKEQLIQVVLNIARNAMQALLQHVSAEGSPQITLRTRTVRQFTIGHTKHRLVLHISIVDNGPGIPEDIRESLFFPMVSGRAEGTGLGLSIAQSIVNQHQGIIECESEPGRTQFSIYLPLELSLNDYERAR